MTAYVGDDYPQYYDIDLPDVSLTPENTIHYQIFTEDAAREWGSIFPPGGGFVYLGPDARPFGLALFHQMHCLARIRRATVMPQSPADKHVIKGSMAKVIASGAGTSLQRRLLR